MMSIEGVGEPNPVVRAAAALPATAAVGGHDAVPVILSVTADEARGARMRVGGLRVVDRAIRLLSRVRDAHVVIATDGSVRLPSRLPANMERRPIDGDPAAGIARLRVELGPEVTVVRGDVVWLHPAYFDTGTQVVDAASRRLAVQAVYRESQRETIGIVDRALNQKISSHLTRLLFARLSLAPALVTLAAGVVGAYGALVVSVGTWPSVLAGFAILEGYAILDGCAGELARVRLHETTLGAWLDTVVGDFVNVLTILAVGLALWRHGGTFLDMKMALVAAAMTLFYVAVSYRELVRQGEGDVMKLRWWFAHGQQLRSVSDAGSRPIKAVMLLGRRDVVIALALVLAAVDQLPIVLLFMMIIAMVRAAGALGQLFTPNGRRRPPP